MILHSKLILLHIDRLPKNKQNKYTMDNYMYNTLEDILELKRTSKPGSHLSKTLTPQSEPISNAPY